MAYIFVFFTSWYGVTVSLSQSSVSFVSGALFDFMRLCEGVGLSLRINSWMVYKL